TLGGAPLAALYRDVPPLVEPGPAAPRLAAGAARWILAALALAIAGCESSHTTLEDALAKVDWFPTMRRQPSIEAYEQPRMPAEGTLPVDGRFPLSLAEAERIARSPLPATAASLERGRTQYEVFCTVCHGPEGSGGGNVAVQQTGFPPGLIASLTSERARALTDGYLYGMILNGRGLMPNYRRIPEEDRWHIVNYVRTLQRRTAAAQAAGP
ncbi:MAG: c-type cytochrome, partial [Gemmatimonadota bacterium]